MVTASHITVTSNYTLMPANESLIDLPTNKNYGLYRDVELQVLIDVRLQELEAVAPLYRDPPSA